MTTPETIAFLSDALAHAQYEVTSLETALALIRDGYQSDQVANQEAIDAGIVAGVDAAVKEATAPLNEQIATLSDQVAEPPTT